MCSFYRWCEHLADWHRSFVPWQAGGFIANNRVNGRLAVTRALGDMDFKDLGKDPLKQVHAANGPHRLCTN
jgi:hypothetical protein